jgi:hypothetical protein
LLANGSGQMLYRPNRRLVSSPPMVLGYLSTTKWRANEQLIHGDGYMGMEQCLDKMAAIFGKA